MEAGFILVTSLRMAAMSSLVVGTIVFFGGADGVVVVVVVVAVATVVEVVFVEEVGGEGEGAAGRVLGREGRSGVDVFVAFFAAEVAEVDTPTVA